MTASDVLPTVRVADVQPTAEDGRWLVRSVWADRAVGIIGGAPKSCKTWFALDLAVSVASGTPCLGRFPVERPGTVIAYLAEDPTAMARERIEGIVRARGLPIEGLDLHLITSPALRLDRTEETERLFRTCARMRPRLLLLDPFVRLHRIDENSAGEVSAVLAELRRLQRTFDLAVVLVHHARKNGRGAAGQALRGSSDLYAWVDSYAYLQRRADGAIQLALEHRFERAVDPFSFRLAEPSDNRGPHLEAIDAPIQDGDDLPEAVVAELCAAGRPLPRGELRSRLKVQNQRLGDALEALLRQRRVQRTESGWTAVPRSQP